MHHLIRTLFLLSSFVGLLACSKPGYLIRIEAEKVNPSVPDRLEETIINRDFETITKSGVTVSGEDLISEYWKDVTSEKYYYISVSLFYSKFSSRNDQINLRVYIENRHKGLEPVIKTEMDEIGDIFFKIISEKTEAKDKLLIERKEVRPRILY